MYKQLKSQKQVRESLKKGLDTVANCVKITIGPRGRNVILDKGSEPLIANDGGIIAREIELKDKFENLGAKIIKSVVQKTSEKVGGGRTCAAILTQAIVNEGLKYTEMGVNVLLLKKGINEAVKDIVIELEKNSQKVKTKNELKQVATISTESEELGEIIASIVHKIGKDGVVTVEEAQTSEITSEITEGLKFDKGYISPYMITNPERMEAEYKDVPILLTDKKLTSFRDVMPVLDQVAKGGKRDLIIIAEDIDGEALSMFVLNKLKGSFNVLGIKLPGFGDNKKLVIEDLEAATGAKAVSDDTATKFSNVTLGFAKKVLSTKDSTVIVDGAGDIKFHVKMLQSQKEATTNKWEQDKYTERIAKLTNGIAVIKVGAASETELKYLKLKIEDGTNECKRALEEGIVVGGDIAYIYAIKDLKEKKGTDGESLGYNLVLKAIEAPFRQIVENGGGKADIVINNLKDKGYNALTGEYVDMFKEGIIDALKVTRTALENAASAAGMFLTIEVGITEEEEKETKHHVDY